MGLEPQVSVPSYGHKNVAQHEQTDGLHQHHSVTTSLRNQIAPASLFYLRSNHSRTGRAQCCHEVRAQRGGGRASGEIAEDQLHLLIQLGFHFILSRMLSGLGGYHVVCFTEPSRALHALIQLMSGKKVEEVSLADLRWIFLDADMPGMSGPDLAKKLLNHPVFQRLDPAHIVGMSSRNDEHRAAEWRAAEWRAAGVHIHADKRFTREDLRTLMSRVRCRGAA